MSWQLRNTVAQELNRPTRHIAELLTSYPRSSFDRCKAVCLAELVNMEAQLSSNQEYVLRIRSPVRQVSETHDE